MRRLAQFDTKQADSGFVIVSQAIANSPRLPAFVSNMDFAAHKDET